MSEIIPAPKKGRWAVHADRTAADLAADLAASGYRLISIKSYLDGARRLYAASAVENVGVTANWNPRITPADLKAQLAAEGGRLISLDAFVEDGKTFCAAVWVKNDGRWWDWRVGVTATTLRSILADDHGQLTCLRVYRPGADPADSFHCAAVWVKADGRDWDWSADIDFDDMYYRLKNGPLNGHALVSWDSFTAGGKTRFASVSWRGAAADGWYYRTPVPGPELNDYVRSLCCYPFDVCRTYPSGFGIVQYAYPPIAHPNARKLVTFGGAGTITAVTNELVQENSLSLTATHSTGGTVTIGRAVRFFPGPGGWCWFAQDTWTTTDPAANFCAPATGIVPGSSYVCNFGANYTAPMEFGVTQVEASDGTFQQQEFAAVPLVAAGGRRRRR